MNRRIPKTTGIDQLSLNLRVTRSPGSSGLSSVLLWPLAGLVGWITVGGFFLLIGRLEVAIGMAQCGGPILSGLGGLGGERHFPAVHFNDLDAAKYLGQYRDSRV